MQSLPPRAYAPRWISTPAYVADVELTDMATVLTPPEHYRSIRALIRVHQYPVGYADIALPPTRIVEHSHILVALDPDTVERASCHLYADLDQAGIAVPPYRLCLADLLQLHASLDLSVCRYTPVSTGPMISVAICTHDRHGTIGATLDSVMRQIYANYEILVIDNAPSNDATERLIHEHYPRVRYLTEHCVGLDNARNRAMHEAHGDIVAFIDDDGIADPGWLQAIAPLFTDPTVLCVTGLVAPAQLETAGQELFERFGYSKGFRRLKFRLDLPPHAPGFPYKGYIGTGCNCALRRDTLDLVGPFDIRLDMGTPVPGGGDHDMFARVIRAGYTLVYEPSAIVFHQHISDLTLVIARLGQYQESFIAFVTKAIISDHRYAWPLLRHIVYWYTRKTVRGLGAVVKKRDRPLALILSEARGAWRGPISLYRSHQLARMPQAQPTLNHHTEPEHIRGI